MPIQPRAPILRLKSGSKVFHELREGVKAPAATSAAMRLRTSSRRPGAASGIRTGSKSNTRIGDVSSQEVLPQAYATRAVSCPRIARSGRASPLQAAQCAMRRWRRGPAAASCAQSRPAARAAAPSTDNRSQSMSEPVIYEQDGRVVTLTLNEPETRNALSDSIVEALVAAVDRINADLSVGCVIITGAGEGFSSGGNVKNMRARTGLFGGGPAEARRGYIHGIQRIPMAMYALEAPSIAAVNGAAVGAGCDLATMCDIRIAGRKA